MNGVPTLTASSPITAPADYCRRARRIRASFNRDPFLRHQALTDLARQRNLQLLVNPQAGSDLQAGAYRAKPAGSTFVDRNVSNRNTASGKNSESIEIDFADQVAAALQPFGFTFSDRIRLLNTAERLGINRFRANVILAMHEHLTGRPVVIDPKPISVAPSLLVVLVIEFAVVAVFVWACIL